MGQDVPKPLYQLPREERNAAAREVARYCLLPDPRPEPQGVGERIGRWFNRHFRTFSDNLSTEQCIAQEINGKLPKGVKTPDLSREEYNQIMTEACRREEIGRLRGQVRDFHDPGQAPQHPVTPSRNVAPGICKAHIAR